MTLVALAVISATPLLPWELSIRDCGRSTRAADPSEPWPGQWRRLRNVMCPKLSLDPAVHMLSGEGEAQR